MRSRAGDWLAQAIALERGAAEVRGHSLLKIEEALGINGDIEKNEPVIVWSTRDPSPGFWTSAVASLRRIL
jgi:hypothetical protein